MAVVPSASLISLFDSICLIDGDNTAFISSQKSPKKDIEVGFTELREATLAISGELHHRHGLKRSTPTKTTTTNDHGISNSSPLQNSNIGLQASVLIASTYPSAGEAAGVLACVRLRIPFIPIDLVGPNRVGIRRLKDVVSDVGCCSVAIVIVDNDEQQPYSAYDYDTAPAFVADPALDEHAAVELLERAGIYRHVMISAGDGTLLNGLSSTLYTDLELPTLLEETDESLQDPLYILYTSGSTSDKDESRTKIGKAVVQTHAGILNRIRWQWDIFPFIQQMKKNIGFRMAEQLLQDDGFSYHTNNNNDTVARRTPLTFVDSICEIFGTILAGATLWCPSPYILEKHGLVGIVRDAQRVGVTRITCLPSQMLQLLQFSLNKEKEWIWSSLNMAIVSGEPCPPTLPSLWERTAGSTGQKNILVNIYGQTETSADVLCMIVSSTGGPDNNCKTPLARFPNATPYLYNQYNEKAPTAGTWWKSQNKNEITSSSLAKCLPWTVPCGIPIANHYLSIQEPNNNDGIGDLLVSGPGLALGYLNRPIAQKVNAEDGVVWFNTFDLAYYDKVTGFYYILGRSDYNIDHDVGSTSDVVGKINGALVHTSEVEAVYTSALNEVILRRRKKEVFVNTEIVLLDIVIHVTAILFPSIDTNKESSSYCTNKKLRLAVFIDLSSIPLHIHHLLSDALLLDVKSLLIGLDRHPISKDSVNINDNDFLCHSSLIPHFVHILAKFPTIGSAKKLDRKLLISIAQNKVLEVAVGNHNNETCTSSRISKEVVDNEIHELICNVFSNVLGIIIDNSTNNFITSSTFVELGGDSMMAIEATHTLNTALFQFGRSRKETIFIEVTKIDIMKYTILELSGVISGTTLSRQKHVKEDISSSLLLLETEVEASIPLKPISINAENTNIYSNNDQIEKAFIHIAWKIPLGGCVDASPTLLTSHSVFGNIIIVGSQGGYLLCCNADSGDVLYTCSLPGKIEGSVTVLTIDTADDDALSHPPTTIRTIVYVCVYKDKPEQLLGSIHAYELISRKRKFDVDDTTATTPQNNSLLKPLWTKHVTGQLKSAPTCFKTISNNIPYYGIIVAGYDGIVRYYNALSGEEIATCNEVGGSIHASPLVFFTDDNDFTMAKALVVSSTWIGKLTCIQINTNSSLVKLWSIDTWSPVYSTPTLFNKQCGCTTLCAIFGAVDGAIRCIDLKKGKIIWKTMTKRQKPIFSKCALITSSNEKVNSSLCDNNYIVFGSHDGLVTCISILKGGIQWTYDMQSSILATPVVLINTATHANSIIAISTSGHIIELNMTNGKLVKKMNDTLDGEVFSSPLVFDGISDAIYVGARDSMLYKIWI